MAIANGIEHIRYLHSIDINDDACADAIDGDGIIVVQLQPARLLPELLHLVAVATDEVLGLDVDVLAPCALGGVINSESIGSIRATIVAGAANNQLASPADAEALRQCGILYCPDFLINAGGIVDVYHQRRGSAAAEKLSHIRRIRPTLERVLQRAEDGSVDTHSVAERMSEEVLGAAAACNSGLAA